MGIIFTEYNYQNQSEFESDVIQSQPPLPFLPLLKIDNIWISGGPAICEFACNFKDRDDLLGIHQEKVKFIMILSVCENLINILIKMEEGSTKRFEKAIIIQQEICPVLSKLNLMMKEKKFIFTILTLADFYLYVILIKVSEIYENTYRDFFLLQKFKIAMDFFLADKMINVLSPALKTIKTEIDNNNKMENSEILIDGKIPVERNNNYSTEAEFWKAVNFIPESMNKSIRMTAFDKNN